MGRAHCQKPTNVAMPESSALVAELIDSAVVGIAVTDEKGLIVRINELFCSMLGLTARDCLGHLLEAVLPPPRLDDTSQAAVQLLASPTGIYRVEGLFPHRQGKTFWGRVSVTRVVDETSGSLVNHIVRLEDIDEQKRTAAAFTASETRWNDALEAAGQGVWDHDLRTDQAFYSRVWRQMRGFGPDEDVDGNDETWLQRVHPGDRERVTDIARRHRTGELTSQIYEYRERHRNGEWIWILSCGKIVEWTEDGRPARVAGTDTDITGIKLEEQRRAEAAAESYKEHYQRLQHAQKAAETAQKFALTLARHDSLTGLPNRRVFLEMMEDARGRAKARAVLVIDLDRFKPVNDVHGHAAGDAVLCEIASRLSKAIRGGDTVVRLGGDEFAIVMEMASMDQLASAAEQLAHRIITTIQQPIEALGRTFEVGASIGIAFGTDGFGDPDETLRAADIAMYAAKQGGRGTWRYFHSSMEAELLASTRLESDLRRAIPEDQIQPYYQPIYRLDDRRLAGFEILARWNHPERGEVPPDTFIPVVERLGLIGELTYKLLHRACRDASAWPSDMSIAINVSPIQIADPLMPMKLLSVLAENNFPPGRLEIEITESAISRDIETARGVIATLRKLGVKISLDDFGTGYSNLHNLREFRFDKIKIDKSFVKSMCEEPGSAKLVQSILLLARNLGLSVVAEGIEQECAILQIIEGGGEFGQGYYFGKPMPAAQVDVLIRESAGVVTARRA